MPFSENSMHALEALEPRGSIPESPESTRAPRIESRTTEIHAETTRF